MLKLCHQSVWKIWQSDWTYINDVNTMFLTKISTVAALTLEGQHAHCTYRISANMKSN